MTYVTAALFPPELVATGDVRGILHPIQRPDKRPQEAAAPATTTQRVPLFLATTSAPRDLGGLALRVGFCVFLIFAVWLVVRPIVYRLFPSLAFAMHGPNGFPITAYVLPDAIAFSNGSSSAWHCDADLWYGGPTASFDLDALGSRTLSYTTFGYRNGDPFEWQSPLTTSMQMKCTEPSGAVHEGFVQ